MTRAQNDQMIRVPIPVPRIIDGQISEADWQNFVKTLANINFQSGITDPDNPTGAGYLFGYDTSGNVVGHLGDFDNSRFIQFAGGDTFRIGSNTVVEYGDTPVSLAFGIQSGEAGDGDVVTFSPAFATVPKVIFGQGGLTYDSTLGSGVDQTSLVQPLNLTTTGFTMKAKISDLGSPSPQTVAFTEITAGQLYEATKTGATEAYDDNYTVDYTVSVNRAPSPTTDSFVSVGIYTKPSGGSYTLRKTLTYYNANTSSSILYEPEETITVDGLGANSVFKIEVLSVGGNGGVINGTDVEYETATVTQRSKTPSGASKIPWVAIATS